MSATKQYTEELSSIIENLPKEKVCEIINFAKFLIYQDSPQRSSAVDENALFLQQQALNKIWNDPQEDIYEL